MITASPLSGVHLIAGTRPEAIKIAPLASELRRRGVPAAIVDTGQQPGRVSEALGPFGLEPDVDLELVRQSGSLGELISLTVARAEQHLRDTEPAAVVVQGDTTTALAVGLAAHMLRVPVVHLEAGLRTYDRDQPFPEEVNRTLLADLADLHLAPTSAAAEALAREGHGGPHVVVTGNTVVDALEVLLPSARERARELEFAPYGYPVLVCTVHRREAWGAGVRTVASAIRRLIAEHSTLHAAVVTHPNPAVAADVRDILTGTPRCTLLEPQPYDEMLALLCTADVVLTDSGGIQEEAPSIGVPVVVAREITERPEGVDAGCAVLTGLDGDRIVKEVGLRLTGPSQGRLPNPYGDGNAAVRAAAAIQWHLGLAERPEDWSGQA